jgi:competence protein ComEC
MADLEVVFMDAGQGDCTLIVYPDGSLTLVDCGSTKSGTEAFGEIKKVIDRKFQSKQDFALVLTHPDEDHYNLLRQIGVNAYLDGGGPCYIYYGGHISLYQNQRENNYTYKLLNHFNEHHLTFRPPKFDILPDTLLSRAGVNVTILAANCTGDPKSENAAKKNSNSIVLLVEYQGAKIFLMGDAFIQTENFIIDNLKHLNLLNRLQKSARDHVVLKMGHHGSDTSTCSDWVKLIQPEVIVVSSGTKSFNGKGMPTKTHLASTTANTTLVTTGINQSYVVFDEANRTQPDQAFVTMPKTNQAIWTTCYEVEWETSNARWFESGQTWYYGIEKSGNKIAKHWYGYTGYDT